MTETWVDAGTCPDCGGVLVGKGTHETWHRDAPCAVTGDASKTSQVLGHIDRLAWYQPSPDRDGVAQTVERRLEAPKAAGSTPAPVTTTHDRDRRTGYATENVTPITALDRDAIEEMWVELRARLPHEHGPYGWRGCGVCRHAEAERVSRRFPGGGFAAVDRPEGETFG